MKNRIARSTCMIVISVAALFLSAMAAFGQEPAAPKDSAAQSTTPDATSQKPAVVKKPSVATRSSADLMAEIEKNGVLRVGVSEIVPWAMHDKDGKLVGFEIDVAKKLARDLGVKVEFYPVEFRYLISDLVAGRYDIIVSGLSINTRRALQVDFSAPYNTTDVTLAVNNKVGSDDRSLKALNKSSVIIGALEGSTAEEITSVELPNAQIRTYVESPELFKDLVDGKIDVAAADRPRTEIVARLFPDKVTCLCDSPLATYPAAFAIHRGDPEFINFLNSWIVARTVNRWLEERRTYWFNGTDWAKNL